MMYFISLDSFKFVLIFFGLFFVISFQEWQKKKENTKKNHHQEQNRMLVSFSHVPVVVSTRSIRDIFSQHRRNFVHSIRQSSYRAQ